MTREVDDPLGAILVLGGGAFLLIQGIRVRVGESRGFMRFYTNGRLPAMWRNGAFLLIPAGAAFVISAVAGGLPTLWPPTIAGQAVRGILGLAVLGLLAAFFWWGFRPPLWLKPRWLREAEASGQVVVEPAGWLDRIPQLVAIILVVVVLGYATLRLARVIGP